jgi:hypothetical protein
MSLPPEKWYICQKKKTVDMETHEQNHVRKQMQHIYDALQQVEKTKEETSKPLVVEVKRPRKRGGTKRKLKENRRELQRALKESLFVSNEKGLLTIKVPEEDSIDNLIEEVTEDTLMNEEQEECNMNEVEPEKTQDDIELEERIYRDVEWVLEEDESTNITESQEETPQEETPQVETPQVELSFDEILQIALMQNEIIKNEIQQIANPQPILQPIPLPIPPSVQPPIPDYSHYLQYLQYIHPTIPPYTLPTISPYTHPTIPQYTPPAIPQYARSPPHRERTHTSSNGYTYWNLGASKFVPTKKRNRHMM